MGRMSDARKRARLKPTSPPALEAPNAEATAAEVVETREAVAPPERSPRPPAEGRFTLPASGLAADILASVAADTVGEGAETAPGQGPHVSFFSAPAREERVAVEATVHLATFFLDREEYGVDVRLVQEIRRVSEITQVPRAPEFIRGVINLRGRIIPVIDLKSKLGLGAVVTTPRSRIVVVTLRERLLGLLVDGASQVLKIPVSLLETPPEEVVRHGGGYVRGVAKLKERLIILVDLATILAVELGEG